ncbi:MAG: putative membrane protein YphA (DoxX/SURF4 family), partial [Arenicella sp.]
MEDMQLRNQKLDVKGRSLLLNVVGIILNITGVVMVVVGFHESTDGGMLLKLTGTFLIVATLAGMIMLKGLYLFSYISRILVGGLFIVSGLVKANDPWGFAFKLEEYFSPTGLAADYGFVESFSPYVLELSIFICVVEIILGAALILGGKIKLASWSLVVMMFFFTWLTWYTSSCVENQELAMQLGEEFSRDCVTDCGCFGDALKGSVGRSLTPLESFWKDIILFYFVLIIFFNQRKIQMNTVKENWVMTISSMLVVVFFSWVFGWYFPIFFALFALLGSFVIGRINIGKMSKDWKMALYVGVVSFIFALYTSMYLPVKDYRAYAIGNNISEQMTNGVDPVIEMELVYNNIQTGKPESFGVDEWEVYMDTTKYEFLERKDVVIDEGRLHSISD